MTRFRAQLTRYTGDPVWFVNVEHVLCDRLAQWLTQHHCEYCQDSDEFTVPDRVYTVLAMWRPVPELELIRL